MNDLATGPDEEPVSEDSIAAVTAVLESLADEINLAEFKRYCPKAGADARTEFVEFAEPEVNEPLETPTS